MEILTLISLRQIDTKLFLDLLFSSGFFPLITRPARLTSHCATLIDNIYVNYAANTYDSDIMINDITDHLPFVFSFLGLKVEKNSRSPNHGDVLQKKVD